jgi:lipid II:glycine glycyltransferase (peptidoglycan interpeptide bridge formation enzyme)
VAFINSYQDDKLLASAFVIFYNHEAVYHYGVSTPDNDDWPGSYATQWAAIQEGKKRDCHVYNFWGIAPEDQPDHRFAGVSLFKRGFGGQEVPYLPAHDLGVTPFYWLTRGFELIRKKVRGL